MRIFAVGDIHGEYRKLDDLLEILFKHHDLNLTHDKLIFMGDYIDRGPESYQVLQKLHQFSKLYPKNVVCLLGNHEQMMIDWYEGHDKWGLWFMNGGKATQKSFDPLYYNYYILENYEYEPKECPKKLLNWLKKLPTIHYEDGFVFSHAPLPREENRKSPKRAGGFYTKEECIWTYGPGEEQDFSRDMLSEGLVGVCGHVHALKEGLKEPRLYDHYVFTDAGCGCHKDAPLCAVEVVSRQVIYSI